MATRERSSDSCVANDRDVQSRLNSSQPQFVLPIGLRTAPYDVSNAPQDFRVSLSLVCPPLSYGVSWDGLGLWGATQLASVLYVGLLENQASELGSRMSAMDSSTKNANEMLNKLTLTYNRSRQAAITTELIEIISGAAALEG